MLDGTERLHLVDVPGLPKADAERPGHDGSELQVGGEVDAVPVGEVVAVVGLALRARLGWGQQNVPGIEPGDAAVVVGHRGAQRPARAVTAPWPSQSKHV